MPQSETDVDVMTTPSPILCASVRGVLLAFLLLAVGCDKPVRPSGGVASVDVGLVGVRLAPGDTVRLTSPKYQAILEAAARFSAAAKP